ncbi:MAG TPA: acyltransferase [Xanthomonadaceae bacterium]|nr:acyltransferase [Xanthomonadaceae bacterium]
MSAHWKQRKEGGGWFAIWLIRSIGRYGGRGVARLLLYPITLYFLLRRPAERRDSRAWLGRALGRPATLRDIARHIHTFAATILDRVFLLSENTRRFDVHVQGVEALHGQLDRGCGVLLFGSHLGSFEVLRVLSQQRPDYLIRVVLDKQHNVAMQSLLDALNPELARNIIDAGQDGPALMLEIQQAVQAGALVALLVDRVQPGGQTVAAPFFGRPAPFPTAPWLIAAVLKVPVVLGFGLYRGGNRYDLAFEAFSDGIDIPRAQRRTAVPALIRRYAQRLEHFARAAPFNWFNFYDFWECDDTADATHAPAAGAAAGDAGPAAARRA